MADAAVTSILNLRYPNAAPWSIITWGIVYYGMVLALEPVCALSEQLLE
jgi:hypothetical protein